MKTRDHRVHHSRRIQTFEIQGMPRLIGKNDQERILGPSVSLAKWMYRISLGREVRCIHGKFIRKQITKAIVVGKSSRRNAMVENLSAASLVMPVRVSFGRSFSGSKKTE